MVNLEPMHCSKAVLRRPALCCTAEIASARKPSISAAKWRGDLACRIAGESGTFSRSSLRLKAASIDAAFLAGIAAEEREDAAPEAVGIGDEVVEQEEAELLRPERAAASGATISLG